MKVFRYNGNRLQVSLWIPTKRDDIDRADFTPHVGTACDEWCTKSIYFAWLLLNVTIFYGSTEKRALWYLSGGTDDRYHFVSPDQTTMAIVPTSAVDWWTWESMDEHPPLVTAGWLTDNNASFERLLDDEEAGWQ